MSAALSLSRRGLERSISAGVARGVPGALLRVRSAPHLSLPQRGAATGAPQLRRARTLSQSAGGVRSWSLQRMTTGGTPASASVLEGSLGQHKSSPLCSGAAAADQVAVAPEAAAEAPPDVTQSPGAEGGAEAEEERVEIFLKDYKPPHYAFDKVDLVFDLHEDFTTVESTIEVRPWDATAPAGDSVPSLVLDGDTLQLVSIAIDGQPLPESGYRLSKRKLELLSPPQQAFKLSIATRIDPANNTALEGLYKSTGSFCTQCEAEGFRRITFFQDSDSDVQMLACLLDGLQDRPDVMSRYTTRIQADKGLYPVLLSNGNLVEEGDLDEGRHFAVWEDPWPKPCYLFALVAGRLECVEDTFKTGEGRDVVLRIWVQKGDEGRTKHAMESLKASMLWDEQVFGLHYDLDLFNIVAVPDFNMGAMENKSLNIFNSRLVLASPETATDADYSAIEGVVAHEYFHNWTGNRVTCRDWFQLTLKEGLTVYRDQEFSSDMNNRAVSRIEDVVRLRASQFSQDAGPMAHPVRPLSYIKMDNFYTVTVYEKGAEVVRMYETLLGKDGFRKGMDLYFARHDGQAVTCDDFFAAMRDGNDVKLPGFTNWLCQAGTPLVTVTSSYHEGHKTLTLKCKQEIPGTPGQPAEEKQPVLIPLSVGLLRRTDGSDVALSSVMDGDVMQALPDGTTTAVLRLHKAEQEFTFAGITEPVVPSLLRGFSAPVRLKSDLTREDQLFLLAHDSDDFNRWEACQAVARELMLSLVGAQQKGQELTLDPAFVGALKAVLTNKALDKAFVARILALPGETEVAELMSPADPDAIHAVAKFCRTTIARELRPIFEALVSENQAPVGEAYSPDHESKARRSLKNTALMYLASLNDEQSTALAVSQFQSAANMTDQFAALASVCMHDTPQRAEALAQFYEQWKHDGLVMNKWLSLQASSSIPGNVAKVRELKDHPAFNITEPNKVYALMGGFASCPVNFHALDGSGYAFIADSVIELDKLNAQVAARIVSAFTRWRNYDEKRQQLAQAELERIKAQPGLSGNVFEIVSKTLAAPARS